MTVTAFSVVVSTLFAAQNVQVLQTAWVAQPTADEISYRVSTTFPVGTIGNIFFSGNHSRTAAQISRLADMACVVWSRAGGMSEDVRCRTNLTAAMVSNPDWNNDNIDGFLLNSVPADPQGLLVLGETWCATSTLSLGECDIWLNDQAAWSSFSAAHNPTGTPAGGALVFTGQPAQPTGTKRPGSAMPIGFDFYHTLLHEVGHSLGLWHGFALDAFGFATQPCPATTYDCPVMCQAATNVAYFPQLDDIETLHNRYGDVARTPEASFWFLDSTGSLVQSSGFSAIAGALQTDIPRIACKPSAAPDTSNQCMLVTHNLGSAPRFQTLTISGTAVTAGTALAASALAEHGVDIAYGTTGLTGDRYFAVGKRPANTSTSSQIVTYSGAVGGATVSSVIFGGFTTHTEPRVSWHRNGTAPVFVVAWPETTGQVRVATFSVTGAAIDNRLLFDAAGNPVISMWPVELGCASHLSNQNQCRVYVDAYGTDSASILLHPLSYTIATDTNGNLVLSSGQLRSTGANNTNATLLMVDATTWANSDPSRGFVGAAYLMTSDRLREFGTNTVAVQVDRDGVFAPADLDITNFSMGAGGRARLSNMTSWDLVEDRALFLVVRPGAL
jgi:hypothetical protein